MSITPVHIPYLRAVDFVQGSDSGNYALAVNRAVAALAGTRGEVVLPNRAEAYRTQMTLGSNVTIRGAGSATEVIQDAQINCFYVIGSVGTKSNLTSNALAGATTVTLPTGGGAAFSAGDLVVLESTTVVYGSGGFTRDMRKVIAVAGDVLTLDGALLHDFLTSATAQYAKVTPKTGIGVRDLLVSNPDPATKYGFAIRAQLSRDVRISGVILSDTGGGILLHDVLDGHVSDCTVDRLRNGSTVNASLTGFGYGVALAGATAMATVANCTFRGTRHAVTTVADERSGSAFWGGPRDCLITGCVSNQSPDGNSHFDTHEYGTNITFANCIASGGGEAGFQIRAQHVVIDGCKAYRCGLRGVNIGSQSSGVLISGGEFAYNGQNGISLSSPNNTLIGAWIHHNAEVGVALGSTATDPLVTNCRIEHNGQTTSTYGIQDLGATNPVIRYNSIPATGTQIVGVLNLGATGVAIDNDMPGYTSGNAFVTPSASAIIRRNRGYLTEANGTATVASGATSIVVNHGLRRTPALKDIRVTPTNNLGTATKFWTSSPTSTQFTINVDVDPGASTAAFAWEAVIL